MDLVEFWTICSANGIILGKEQRRQIERYQKELIYWNAQVNLISRKDEEHILDKHILPSLSLLKYVELPIKARCLDVGTGGGFPGIPLAIARPDLHMLLVDSIGKKIKITGMLAKHTEIRTINSIRCRAEDLADIKEYLNHFDAVFARGVSKTSEILGWVKRLMKKKSVVCLYKGGDITEEIETAKKDFPGFDFEVHNISVFGAKWFEEDEKKLVVCRKIDN